VHVLQAVQKGAGVGVSSGRFYSLLNNIIGKAVFLTLLPSDLLPLDLSPDGRELALTLLTALPRLKRQVHRQELAELLKVM
jgi:hypothetical protein